MCLVELRQSRESNFKIAELFNDLGIEVSLA